LSLCMEARDFIPHHTPPAGLEPTSSSRMSTKWPNRYGFNAVAERPGFESGRNRTRFRYSGTPTLPTGLEPTPSPRMRTQWPNRYGFNRGVPSSIATRLGARLTPPSGPINVDIMMVQVVLLFTYLLYLLIYNTFVHRCVNK